MEKLVEAKKQFDILYVDPPWDLSFVRSYYSVLSKKQLLELPVGKLGTKDSVIFLWTVTSGILDAIELMNAWGYYFVDVAFVWVKTKNRKLHFGLGKTSTRRNCEFLLYGIKYGAKEPMRSKKNVYQVHVSPILEPFSRKPDIFRKLITDLLGTEKTKVELFARIFKDSDCVTDWTFCGHDIGKNAKKLKQ
jgi:N6-adenosine-specific RNA methylase IME4